MDNLTQADLFSPSKARQQRLQAQDWAQIDSWLSYKYAGRTVPTFERNEETLKVLRELSMANERADEERTVHERLEREALKQLEKDEESRNPDDKEILETITAHLTSEGSAALHALASTTVALNTPNTSPETIAHMLIQHTVTGQNLKNHIQHIQTLQAYLQTQHSLLRRQLSELQSNPAFTTPANLPRQTTDTVRQTKHLRSKIREYEDKLSSLQSSQSRVNKSPRDVSSSDAIMEMLEQQQSLDELRERVEGLEKEVDVFGGLPADKEAARKEVGRLEVELDQARRRRDGKFEELVGR
ncbi:hypothetical protein P154DRAFT_545272 [Amniculicola lignicola CBS 123094]|uniref:HAUS augmin-like complex subunit 1 n=1 Tax=Amniculicola lignicola CBS 123094 TaxID=1392246 RepID=A0A6A5WLF9_9PLEO|nr:hypothetical protein P154DRAFT_545272 [Amniculicola lignicola CBS 123094]